MGELLDIQNFVDFLIVQIYSQNHDWPMNNWTAMRERSETGKFMFYAWDTEAAMTESGWTVPMEMTAFNSFPSWAWPQDTRGPGLNGGEGPSPWLYRALKVNPDFRQLFADRVQKHFFNGGALMNENVINRFYELKQTMALSIPEMTDWIADTFVPQRRPVVLDACVAEGMFAFEGPRLYLNDDAQHGGYGEVGDLLSLHSEHHDGAIYYTLDGSDPWTSDFGKSDNKRIATSARLYLRPLTLMGSTQVKARIKDGSQWSGLVEATFAVDSIPDSLRITELMYHPEDVAGGIPGVEFVELYNSGAQSINLNLVQFTNGIDFTFSNYELSPGGYVVVVSDQGAFEEVYGMEVPVAGVYAGRLNNGGERIRLEDAAGAVIHDFKYNDSWYDSTDGLGFSLQIVDVSNPEPLSWALPESWRASNVALGTPGASDD
jgi:hypothetical protein